MSFFRPELGDREFRGNVINTGTGALRNPLERLSDRGNHPSLASREDRGPVIWRTVEQNPPT